MRSTPSSMASMAAEARVVAGRFAGSLLAALISGGLFVYLADLQRSWGTIAVAASSLALGIPLFLALDLALERSPRFRGPTFRGLAYAAGLAVLTVHFWLTRGDTTTNYPVRYLQLGLAAHLLVAFAAFVSRDEENGFWQFNRHV